jgi:glucose-6-phosphate isomerase
MTSLTNRAAWKALETHFKEVQNFHLRDMFASDPTRGTRLTLEAVGLYLDYSKNRVNDETLSLLLELAKDAGLTTKINAMFLGEKINITENRAVLHTALRAPRDSQILVDGVNVVPEVHAVLDKMAAFAEQIRQRSGSGHGIQSIGFLQ